ncbi:SusC/RagA family TonB-linked outer membrane protein [Salegentibacter maritimus]|uniref:SusC/RagA family TonB-linked outer membrane protein n=1 Tax=Salegentibacter maritimus TaxID=2794347 RepID=A0ABS0TJ47_9FLAO|nr:SusC/RagA family TonB-linked outer membrane protein [Salegentibacter maritimus]MBI6120790.1 SusC/RagA family TonB-linked outer membrane protein [Salegentibacter maritimus]
MNRKLFLFACLFLCSINLMLAQTQTVSGSIVDAENGMPLPGVNVIEKGTSNGVSSDFDGMFSIEINEGSTLQFSMLGYIAQEVKPDGSEIQIKLAPDTQALDEVVVTALGIKREQKSLGYALQEVGGEELVESRESNLANAFTGKVAGLNVVRGSGGPASSSKIVLRGNNSLTGDNQPLIVVDGVPMDNFTGAENNDYFNPSRDTGNGLGDIDPENIESMSVLKGASAAALYGSRAGNGVILITTKSGKAQEGLGITYNVNLGFEELFLTPDMQSSFAQGTNNIYGEESTLSWGPKIEGQLVTDYNGQEVPLRAYDNVGNFFNTGVSLNQSLSFSQKVNNTSVYSSVSYLDNESMIPGAELNRTNLLTRATTTFGPNERWTTDVKVQYMNNKATNRPLGGDNRSNAFFTMYKLPSSVDIRDFKNPKDEFGKMTWFNADQVNPYWNAKYNTNTDSRDRFLLNGSLKYEFADWLTGEIKGGSDMYTTSTEKKVYDGSPIVDNGIYSLGKRTFMENNFSALFTARKDDILGNFGVSGSLGGNLMHRKSSRLEAYVGELEVPDFFSINNGVERATVEEGSTEYKINSIYGTFQLNYDGYLFLDLTGRNDWSSSLSKENRSFFYPSVSTSVVLNDLIKDTGGEMPGWITFSKLRASYAEVGNDLDPYQLYNSYYLGKNSNDKTLAGRNNVLYNPDLQSELIKSWEAGFDLRFLDNRIGLDFSWYKTNATRQLIEIDLNPLSGYSKKKVNAGDIQNQGIEVMLNATILDNPEGLSWSTNVNFSKNENTLNELTPDLDRYSLGGYDNVEIIAEAGSGYGNIYGTKFRRVEDQNSPYFGKLILNESGLPLESDGDLVYLGNQQPDALVGWNNSFKWKRFNFSFLIDGRFGGEIFSGTNAAMQLQGTAAKTVVNGQREDFVVDGVIDVTPEGASENVYQENQAVVSHQNYWEAVAGVGNLGITEANIYDATNIRLRNINLSYDLPEKWVDVLALTKAKVGLSANNVWMIDSNMNGIDPESVFATGTNATGFENGSSPTSRSYFFNVSLSF